MIDDANRHAVSGSILRLGVPLAVAAALPVLAACESDATVGPAASGNYRVSLAQTDDGASAERTSADRDEGVRAARLSRESVEAVEITLEAVEVYRLNADTTGADTTRGPDARWVRLEVVADSAGDSTSVVLDLTELPDDSTGVQVAAGDLEPGTYRGLRLRFSGAELVLSDSARLGDGQGAASYGPGTYDLFVPSGAQTGVKLPSVRFTMASGDDAGATTVLADTDASIRNINITGRGFLMTPVLKAADGDSTTAEDTTGDGS